MCDSAREVEIGAPIELFEHQGLTEKSYAAAPDGQRFVVVEPVDGRLGSLIQITTNWPEALREAQRER